MSILETIASVSSSEMIKQLAGQFGISAEQASSSISTLLPALANGMKERLASGDGASLLQLINGGTLTKFADNPSSLGAPEAVQQGNSLLNRVFGSQDLSSLVAKVAEKAGVSNNVIQKLLPIGATLLGGFLSRSSAAGGNVSELIEGIAASGHGGIIDTVKGLGAKLFG